MAFGKKKDDAATAAAAEVDEEPSAPLDSDAPDAALAPPEDAAAEAPPAAASGGDALLSMFQASQSEVDDLSVLVDLAGDADLDDILEELRTLRAALGITDAYEEELAAA
jgi:hypothetical protein